MGTKYEEDFCCIVCNDIFKDPVLLTCSHAVCEHCLKDFWVDIGAHKCPVCRRRSSKDQLLPNLVLKNLCETFWQERSQKPHAGCWALCKEHSEQLKFYCVEHDFPVCVVCQFDSKHTCHTIKPRNKFEPFDLKARSIHIEQLITEEFEQFHQFLRDEEKVRLAIVRQEKEEKLQMLWEMSSRIRRKMTCLNDTIKAIQRKLETDGDTNLKDPEKVSEILLNKTKHLDKLKSALTLDHNTAHPDLVLSEDLTTVRFVENNPQRYDLYHSVLGSVGFDMGTHCWDVEVGDYPRWILGVMAESAKRKGDFTPMSGRWFMWRNDDEYAARATPTPSTFLKVEQKPQRIRVQLDWNGGELSFFDADTFGHIHTLKDTFKEKVYPYFNTVFTLKVLQVDSGWMTAEDTGWTPIP
ncbi:E3 ubiquitin-protein ligase TRIM39-like [Alosa pseudoharengus]|uniref:E3 ubiquitin-protein ligase TRIM39-like n=1 Tax=Alosa pseudoharengus TaxID=34774 RepID=UPI003F898883